MSKTILTTAAVIAMSMPAAALGQQADNQGQAAERPVGLAHAMQAAEQALGARAVEGELETERGRLVYEIELLKDDDIHEAVVDAVTGEVVSSDRRSAASAWNDLFGSGELEAVKNAPQSLGEVLAGLEQQEGRLVREAELEEENGRYYYEIVLVGADGARTETWLDAATGETLAAEPDD